MPADKRIKEEVRNQEATMLDKMGQGSESSRGRTTQQNSQAPPNFESLRPTLTEYQRALAANDTLQEENSKILAEITIIKAEHARICENGKKLGEICLKDRQEMAALKTQNETLRGENQLLLTTISDNKMMFDRAQEMMVHSRGLQSAVDALNAERDMLQPLVAVGVATRLRFLEKGKQNAVDLTADQMQGFPEIVRDGNQAGHCGNLLADNYLFNAKMFDPKYESSLSAVFEKLYRHEPLTTLENTPQMHIRVENLLATLTTNYAPPLPGQDKLLQQHWEDFRIAWEEYDSFLPRLEGVPTWVDSEMAAYLDSNKEACDLVEKMEKIGGEIIMREGTSAL